MAKKTPQKYIKTKVIEANVLFLNPNRLKLFIFASDSIESLILDLQEMYPNENITRASVINWEFLTVAKAKEHGVFDLINERNKAAKAS
jgi:hypothetical protein